MDQRRIRRVIAAAALAMTLALAPPAHAAGGRGGGPEPGLFSPGLFSKAWQWLAEVSSLWTGGPQQAPATRQDPAAASKRSMGIDPNGFQAAAINRIPASSEGSMSNDPND